ncbi:hypothetical protein GCM10007874_42570 [Labrys miyagiensis]|uniref:Cytochrome b n=1 Tax=Labrys miyagiensis TaxID=346912 RepID=A0ABQ6CN46_9HYPH|nr:hypothetical protein [Labrys miyagiensis]GLS21240.1 hypothetical protein GCM10007874_42570 [Labrys miyagiensis]
MITAPLQPATLARRVGLVLILYFGTQGLVAGLRGLPGGGSAFFLCLYIHLWVSIYDGIFDRGRRLSWLALNLSWVGAVFGGFLGYVMPWGQMRGYFTTVLANHLGEQSASEVLAIAGWLAPLGAGLAVLRSMVFVLDIVLMHRQGSQRVMSWRLLLPAVCAMGLGATAAMLSNLQEAVLPAESAQALPSIIPEWFFLPVYAMLRCLPGKLAGILLMFAATLPPLIAPWIGAARCRLGPARRLFMGLCALLALCWVFMGWLGAQEVTELSNWAVRILAPYYFAFFLILIPALSRWTRRRQAWQNGRALNTFD